jgi:hypothetical protein
MGAEWVVSRQHRMAEEFLWITTTMTVVSRMPGRPDGKALEDDEHSRRGSEGWKVDHLTSHRGFNNARQLRTSHNAPGPWWRF